MIYLVPVFMLFVFFILLFVREDSRDKKRLLDKKRLDNEHVLREVERFLTEDQKRR